jgi:hypothetical protein
MMIEIIETVKGETQLTPNDARLLPATEQSPWVMRVTPQ